MIICVDFDGTCVTHAYPDLGVDIGAVPVLRKLVERGHRLILLTMRSGTELDAAKYWFQKNEIPLWSVNSNPDQHRWTSSPKVYGQLYIDDAALGAPLLSNETISDRDFINWKDVEVWLQKQQIL